MMTTLAADLHNRLFQALEEKKVALARFQWSCYADDPITPKDTIMTLFPTDVSREVPPKPISDSSIAKLPKHGQS